MKNDSLIQRFSPARLAGVPASKGELAAQKGEHMPGVSFETDIKPLFRAIDVSHMKRFNVELDNYTYMSNPNNANQVLANVSPHDGEPPSMPPGGPYWTEAQLALLVQWQRDGYQP